jgi:hypothetical protein
MGGRFQWRLQGGYDWSLDRPFGQAQLDYRLDSSGSGSIGISARLQREEWIYGITLSLRPTVGFLDGAPFLMTRSQLDPQLGGLKGLVFMDRNGNGTRERGERGIGGIEVITDSGQRLTSSGDGGFVLQPRDQSQEVHVRLNPNTVPAYYSPTNGAQWAEIEKGSLTRVGLGLIILSSVSGTVHGADSQDTTRVIPLGGVRVLARTMAGEALQESVTADDGSYYLGELIPGTYQLDLDEETLPRGYTVAERPEPIVLEPITDPIDLYFIDLRCAYAPPVQEEKVSPEQETPEEEGPIKYRKF